MIGLAVNDVRNPKIYSSEPILASTSDLVPCPGCGSLIELQSTMTVSESNGQTKAFRPALCKGACAELIQGRRGKIVKAGFYRWPEDFAEVGADDTIAPNEELEPPIISPEEIVARLRGFLEARGWSAHWFARAASLNQGTISSWLRGDNKPRSSSVSRLRDALDRLEKHGRRPERHDETSETMDASSRGVGTDETTTSGEFEPGQATIPDELERQLLAARIEAEANRLKALRVVGELRRLFEEVKFVELERQFEFLLDPDTDWSQI